MTQCANSNKNLQQVFAEDLTVFSQAQTRSPFGNQLRLRIQSMPSGNCVRLSPTASAKVSCTTLGQIHIQQYSSSDCSGSIAGQMSYEDFGYSEGKLAPNQNAGGVESPKTFNT